MGAFRDFFTELWNNYIKKPIDSVKDAIPDINKWWEEKVESTFEGIKDAIPDINKWWEEKVESTFEGIKDAIPNINKWWEEKVKGTFTDMKDKIDSVASELPKIDNVKEAVNNVQTWFAEKVNEGLWSLMERLEPDAVDMVSDAIDDMLEIEELPESYKKILNEIKGKKSAVGLMGALSFLGGTAVGYAMNPLSVLLKPATHKLNQSITPEILPLDSLITLHYRKVIDDEFFYSEMGKWGYDKEQADRLRKAYLYYPSPTDFIRFATRDVFREDIVEKYGYDSEWDKIESGIKEYVEKAGINLDVLKWYWRAHWVLPSPRMAYEMLHRGIITQDDIRELLRISDYAPNWIEKLIAISYSPITRVDLRRLYQIGVIDEDRLLKGYKDLGYSEEDAKLMVEWTKLEYSQEDKDLTKTEILRNYRIGQCTREEAKNMLIDLGYDDTEADWILLYEDYKLSVEEIEAEAETIVYELSEGNISYEEAISKLGELNMPERVKLRYLNKAKREVRKTTKRPSTDDLKRWFKMGIIDEKTFKEEMSKNKWNMMYIDNFIKEVKGKK